MKKSIIFLIVGLILVFGDLTKVNGAVLDLEKVEDEPAMQYSRITIESKFRRERATNNFCYCASTCRLDCINYIQYLKTIINRISYYMVS